MRCSHVARHDKSGNRKNPWEALHKIRNGQPGQPMPVLRVLPLQDMVDILAYVQTLPAK